MKILLVEPYFTGSHAAWAEGYRQASCHQVEVLSLPGRFWKWRMHGGAVTLARLLLESTQTPDLILTTDMLDLSTFLALSRQRTAGTPVALYFHENQLTYPWSPADRDIAQKRDKHYGFINYTSALAADAVLFNSEYHQASFLAALPQLLRHFPDFNELDSVSQIRKKSRVMHLGLDLRRFDEYKLDEGDRTAPQPPLILWHHRWEHDKRPEEFFKALTVLSEGGLDFKLAILGEQFSQQPEVFLTAKETLGRHIVQFGYVDSFGAYARWLWRSDIVPVTSIQDFFGASVVEAIYCNCFPLLPHRLAYPYIIPKPYHDHCFYEDFDDLVHRLGQAITNITHTRKFSLRSEMIWYDWRTQSQIYDALLANMVD
jgi:glycosyltransferase involved in cell wall biosynthesis